MTFFEVMIEIIRSRFFARTFLLTNLNRNIVLKILFLTINNLMFNLEKLKLFLENLYINIKIILINS